MCMKRGEVFAWGMYDLANTIYSALFVTIFYPLYIKQFLGGNEFQIGLVFGLSMLAVGVAVPVVGAWSDLLGKRMPFIAVFTVICCLFTAFVAAVPLSWALIAGFLANFSYHAALTTYNALLPKIATRRERGNVSGIGTAMGYVGTLVSLGIASLLLVRNGWETAEGAQSVFVATAVMFFVFSLFTFFGVKEKSLRIRQSVAVHLGESVRAVFKTVTNVSRHRPVLWFLLSMFLVTNAINAVIVFLFLFARQEINLSVKAFFVVYTIQSIGAVVGSIVAGKATDRLGARRVLLWSIWGWVFVIVLLLFVKGLPMFVLAGTLGGAALGAVWTAQRPKLLELVEEQHAGQFFGFLELTNKFSGILGPIVFGALAAFVNYQAALISVLGFFGLGLLFLRGVPK